MPDLIEIDSLTIDDMRNLAREHAACRSERRWLASPTRTTQEVIEKASKQWECLDWVLGNLHNVVNLLPLQDAAIDIGGINLLEQYARSVPGADQDRLQAAIDKLENAT